MSSQDTPRIPHRFATVPLDMTKEEHTELDQAVLSVRSVAASLRETNECNFALAQVLLSAIVKNSPNLNQDYIDNDQAAAVIETNDGLLTLLRDVLKKRDFAEIRILGTGQNCSLPHHSVALLQAPKQVPSPTSRKRPVTFHKEELAATQRAWTCPYKGDSDSLLRRTIARMNAARGDNAYANYLPIVQSSGTGKSRMVDEVAKKIFTIPINLREDKNGYPGPDNAICEFFKPRLVDVVKNKKESFDEASRRFLFFFLALFEIVREEVEKMTLLYSPECLASRWRERLSNEFRDNLYERVIERANTTLTTVEGVVNVQRHLKYPVAADDPEILKVIEAGKNLVGTILKISGKSKSGEKEGEVPDVPLMIYLDESQSLTMSTLSIDESGSSSQQPGVFKGVSERIQAGENPADVFLESLERSPYQVLCSTLNSLRQVNFFAIFLSTNSSLSHFAPSQRYFWSARYRHAPVDTVQAPFVETPFDVWREEHLLVEDAHLLDDVVRPEFMVRFGRPLFWTRYESDSSGLVKHDILKFAEMKLMAQAPQAGDKDGFLAALSVRLLLEFEPRRVQAVEVENRLVEGHLRIAYSVPRHREYLRSGTPSEPIIAEAAARALQNQRLPRLLSQHVSDGLIGKGERGELVARLLLTLAHDQVVRDTLQDRPSTEPLNFSIPIPVTTFLRALFSDKVIETILNCRPDNEHNGRSLRDAFDGAYVHFTHFAKAGDNSVVSDNQAWVALCRGIAWQCHDQQPSIDILIPIALDESKLCRWNVSAFGISIKDRRMALGSAQTHIDLESMGFFSPQSSCRDIPKLSATAKKTGHTFQKAKSTLSKKAAVEEDDTPGKRPYIALTLQLGVQPPRSQLKASALSSPIASNLETPSKIKVTQADGPKTRGREHVKHPRYNITALGCSDYVYRVVEKSEKNVFAELLASRSLFDEHPRQQPENIQAVQRLKPSWNAGPGSYQGIKRSEPVESDSALPPPDLHFEGDVVTGGNGDTYK